MYKNKAKGLREKLQESGIEMHGARLDFMARFIMALITVRTVSLAAVASVLNAAVEVASNEKRIKRFFGDISIEQEMLAKAVLTWLPQGPYLLTLDRTNWKLGGVDINILIPEGTGARTRPRRHGLPAAMDDSSSCGQQHYPGAA
jgi:hypothetical protein